MMRRACWSTIGICMLATTAALAHSGHRSDVAALRGDSVKPQQVIVIAHRGASGERPEHTLAAYRLAIEQGADFIEPDLVSTRDGVLIARHENELSGTTDIASHAQFAKRKTDKRIDGYPISGWFSEDFTLAEIKTLRARERVPLLRPQNTQFDGLETIPTLTEILDLVREFESRGRVVGIYPEIKHPTWFATEGRREDGEPIHHNLGQMLVDQLQAAGFSDAERVFIQSFELASLLQLSHDILPRAGLRFPLLLLMGDLDEGAKLQSFAHPYDVRYAAENAGDLDATYAGLALALGSQLTGSVSFADLAKPGVLAWLRANGIAGIGPWKDSLLQRMPIVPAPADPQRPKYRLTGAVHAVLADARAAGLHVHTYTLRAEPVFLVADEHGATLTMEQELRRLLDAGISGFFTDHPARGVAERDAK